MRLGLHSFLKVDAQNAMQMFSNLGVDAQTIGEGDLAIDFGSVYPEDAIYSTDSEENKLLHSQVDPKLDDGYQLVSLSHNVEVSAEESFKIIYRIYVTESELIFIKSVSAN